MGGIDAFGVEATTIFGKKLAFVTAMFCVVPPPPTHRRDSKGQKGKIAIFGTKTVVCLLISVD